MHHNNSNNNIAYQDRKKKQQYCYDDIKSLKLNRQHIDKISEGKKTFAERKSRWIRDGMRSA